MMALRFLRRSVSMKNVTNVIGAAPYRCMTVKKGGGCNCGGESSDKKNCGKKQFFGGCFKKSEEFKCPKPEKKENTHCRDPCKDGKCKGS